MSISPSNYLPYDTVTSVLGDMLYNQAGLSNKGWYGGSYTQSNYITKTLDDFNVTGTDSW